MAQQGSYCLDVFIDGEEILREELLDFLKKEKMKFEITKGQYGMWGDIRVLRVLTPQAKALADHISKTIKDACDYSYDDYDSQKKAENSQFWNPGNNNPFDIVKSYFN